MRDRGRLVPLKPCDEVLDLEVSGSEIVPHLFQHRLCQLWTMPHSQCVQVGLEESTCRESVAVAPPDSSGSLLFAL